MTCVASTALTRVLERQFIRSKHFHVTQGLRRRFRQRSRGPAIPYFKAATLTQVRQHAVASGAQQVRVRTDQRACRGTSGRWRIAGADPAVLLGSTTGMSHFQQKRACATVANGLDSRHAKMPVCAGGTLQQDRSCADMRMPRHSPGDILGSAWDIVNIEANLDSTVAVGAGCEAGKQRVPAARCADGLAQAACRGLSSDSARWTSMDARAQTTSTFCTVRAALCLQHATR